MTKGEVGSLWWSVIKGAGGSLWKLDDDGALGFNRLVGV